MGSTSGVLDWTKVAISLITYSLDFPPPPPVLGCTERIDSSISNVAVWEFVI